MSEGKPRKAVAEIRFGQDRSGITKIGGRPIHQYWHHLSPHFRDVLLAPQRRSDDIGVSWTWKEPAGNKPLTAAELAGVRNRLTSANRMFLESPMSAVQGEDASGGLNAQKIVEQLGTGVKSLMGKLNGKNDTQLARFVCRTETGPMIHSWGVSTPAEPYYPENVECEISGFVLVSGKPSAGHEVVMENAKGASVARTRSDETGAFNFPKVFPGRYRIRVISDRVDFPLKGVTVTVERESITRLELRSSSNPADRQKEQSSEAPVAGAVLAAPPPTPAERKRRRKLVPILIMLTVLLAGGGIWAAWQWSNAGNSVPVVAPSVAAAAPLRSREPEEKNEPADVVPASGGLAGGAGWGALAGGGTGAAAHRAAHPSSTAAKGPAHHKPAGSKATGGKEQPDGAPTAAGRSENPEGESTNANEDPARPVAMPEEPGETPDLAAPITTGSLATDAKPFDQPPTEKAGPDGPDAPVGTARSSQPAEASTAAEPAKLAPAAAPAPTRAGKAAAGKTASSAPVVIARPAVKVAAIGGTTVEEQLSGINPSGGSPVPDDGPAKAAAGASDGTAGNGEASSSGADAADGPAAGGSAAGAAPAGAAPAALGPAAKVAVTGNPVAAKGKKVVKKVSTKPGKPADGSNPDVATPKQKAPSADGPDVSAPPAASVPAGSPVPPPAAAASAPAATEAPAAVAPDLAVVGAPPSGQNPTATKTSAKPAPPPKPGAAPMNVAAKTTANPVSASPASAAPAPGQPAENSVAPADSGTKADASAAASASLPDSMPVSRETDRQDTEPGALPQIPTAAGLVQRTGLRLSQWTPQMIQDVIIPTVPVRMGEDDAVDALREQLQQEVDRQMVATFRNPVIQSGCAFELPPETLGGADQLHWRDANGATPAGSTVQGGRAEISWLGGRPPATANFVLVTAEGREIVRVYVAADGELVCKTARTVRCWYWVGIIRAVVDGVGPGAQTESSRFAWQLLHGPEIPAAWRRDDHWRNGHGWRIELPLGKQTDGLTGCTLAMVDRNTGWALAGEIRREPGATTDYTDKHR